MRDSRLLEKLETGKENTFVEVELYYTKGGWNYFNGGFTNRGYYVKVKVVTYNNGGYFTSKEFSLFSGYKRLLQETNRFSQKAFDNKLE